MDLFVEEVVLLLHLHPPLQELHVTAVHIHEVEGLTQLLGEGVTFQDGISV